MPYLTLKRPEVCIGCHSPIRPEARAFHKEGRGMVCLGCCSQIAAKKQVKVRAPVPRSKKEAMQATIAGMPEARRAFYMRPQDFSPEAQASGEWLAYLEGLSERRAQGIPDEF